MNKQMNKQTAAQQTNTNQGLSGFFHLIHTETTKNRKS